MILAWALDFAILAIAAAVALCLWRLLRGPEITDRVLALDTLYVNAVALAILLGLRLSTLLLFEAALIIALLGFVSTVALGRYLARGDVIE
jgi:multicomponent K+:H+ antiporter subunit F